MQFFWVCVGATLFCIVFAGRLVANDEDAGEKIVPRDQYELKYLGCSLKKDGKTDSHTGNFLFIWKSDSEVQILGIISADGKSFTLPGDFEVHQAAKWIYVGRTGLEAPGTQWFTIKPGAVKTFKVDMFFAENEVFYLPSVRGADKAHLLLQAKQGQLASDDIPLPLVPNAGK